MIEKIEKIKNGFFNDEQRLFKKVTELIEKTNQIIDLVNELQSEAGEEKFDNPVPFAHSPAPSQDPGPVSFEAKVRVMDLSKELGISNNATVETAKALGIEVKSHLSMISLADSEKIKAKTKEVKVNA
jgi:hypothetical protein